MGMYKRKGSGAQISRPSKTRYIRINNVIYEANENGGIKKSEKGDKVVFEAFKFINQAKRKSRTLQMQADGGMGAGTVSLGN